MKKLFLLLLLAPLLSSCSFVNLERQIYPICISVDATDDGRFLLAIQAPRSSGTGSDSASYDIVSATGETLQEALRLLSASTPYPLNFSQIRLCIISYRLASTTPLRPLLRVLMEQPTMRPTAYVSIALGRGLDVLQNQQPDFGMRLSTHLTLLLDRLRQESILPDSTLSACVRELSDGRCDLLIGLCAVNQRLVKQEESAGQDSSGQDGGSDSSPAFAPGQPGQQELLPQNVLAGMMNHTSPNSVEYLGSAAVSEGRVSGVLTADETQLVLRLLNEARRRVARHGEELQLQIVLKQKSDLALETQRVEQLVQKLQVLDSDALLFGGICAMGFSTNAQWDAYGFRSRYHQAGVAVTVE
ncbi:MAG: hypothetical protein PUE14_03125 [Clostridia bacterium]|nr:hypothetical protein [Clostridia bacterium]